MTAAQRNVYLFFLLALAVWTGGGVFETIASHAAWYADPVTYTRGGVLTPGTLNPWPVTTAVLALATLAALALFWRYHGSGRREVLTVLLATIAVLAMTGFYFVPTLVQLGAHARLTDAQIVSMSRAWISLNLVRIAALLVMLLYALVGLMRLARGDGRVASVASVAAR